MNRLLRHPALKSLLRLLIGVLRRVTPRGRHVVVNGFPDSEGNAVEVVRELVGRGHDVRWVVDGEPRDAVVLLGSVDGAAPTVVRKRSAAGFWSFVTAGLTLFTHGLYQSPPPPRRKPVVNLWHGDGPKHTVREHVRTVAATYLVSGTRLFGELKSVALDVPKDRLLVVGNPRWDLLRRPADDADLAALGLDPRRRFVVFLPTFRTAVAFGLRQGWSDVASTQGGPQDTLHQLAAAAAPHGVQVVVKPHPYDAETYTGPNVVTLVQADLERAGVQLYRLLGRSAALVTDYSSVWTDYLVLDRPLGFALGDLASYTAGSRGLDVDLAPILPGPSLVTDADWKAFLDDVVAGGSTSAALRRASAERIGLAPTEGSAAERLLDELERRGVLPRP